MIKQGALLLKMHAEKVCFFRRVSPLRRDPGRAPPLSRGLGWARIGLYGPILGPDGPIWAQVMGELGQQQYDHKT